MSQSTPWVPQIRFSQVIPLALLTLILMGCQPSDRTPGQWLRGNTVEGFPADWRFTDAIKEIQIEVQTPYLVPHSVTIWCAQVNGDLFIGARNPHEKKWPGWMTDNRDIRLKIGQDIYAAKAADLTDEAMLAAVRAAYQLKYDPGAPGDGKRPQVRYWAVVPRS